MKKLITMLGALVLIPMLHITAFAANTTHTVAPGDSMWKIATKYQVGLSEIKSANP